MVELLRYGASPDQENKAQQTPLQLAIRHGHGTAVKILLKAGAQTRDTRGWCAVIEAASRGHVEVVKELATTAARQPGGHIDSENMIGETPLILAVRAKLPCPVLCRHVQLCHYKPIECGGRRQAKEGDVQMVQILLRLGATVDWQEKHGTTALMAAADNGHQNVVELLMERGADTNLVDEDGHSAMLYASRQVYWRHPPCRRCCGSRDTLALQGQYQVLRALMDYGANAYPHGGRRVFDQPAWGPTALRPGLRGSLAMSLPHEIGVGGRLENLAARPDTGLMKHALDLKGMRTMHSSGTAYNMTPPQTQFLPKIQPNGKAAVSLVGVNAPPNQKMPGHFTEVLQSAGEAEYQDAKRRLLEDLFGPPPKAKERPKPHKAQDGKAFETRSELKEYEEKNFPLLCTVEGCQRRFKHDFELATHIRSHKPAGFLEEEARVARERGHVDGSWLEIDLGDLYMEMHDLRTSILRALGDDSVDADELDSIIRQLRHCGVPQEDLSRLLVALGDGDTSPEDKKMLMGFCCEEVPKQKAATFDLLTIYQGHLKIIYQKYAKKNGPNKDEPVYRMLLSDLTRFLKDANCIKMGFKVSIVDEIFARIIEQRPTGQEVEMSQSKKKKPQHWLTESEFVNAIVRVAYAKFKRLLGVDDKLLWLMKHHILEHEAVKIVDDPIAGMLAKRKVKDVFAEHKDALKTTFNRYGEKIAGRPVISLGAFLGFLKACGLVDDKLTVRECRYIFLANNNDEDTAGEPEGGGKAEDAITLPWEGFMHCIARMAREKDRLARVQEAAFSEMSKNADKAASLMELNDQTSDEVPQKVFDAYIRDDFIPKTTGLDFWQLKKLAIGMKRVTKKNAAKKEKEADNTRPQFTGDFKEEALIEVQRKHGLDVANILAEESDVRTVIYSALANVNIDMDKITKISAYLHDCGVGPEDVQFVVSALHSKGKLKTRAKELLSQYNIPTSPSEESTMLDETMTGLLNIFHTVWLFYSTGGVFNRASPLGFLDGPGLQELTRDCGLMASLRPNAQAALGMDERATDDILAREWCQKALDTIKMGRNRAAAEKAAEKATVAAAAADAKAAAADTNVAADTTVAEAERAMKGMMESLSPTWQWHTDTFKGVQADLLAIDELTPLVVRMAHDTMRHVAGGTCARVKALAAERLAGHWATTAIEHSDIVKKFKTAKMRKVVSTHKAALRKIFKNIGDWDNKANSRSFSIVEALQFLESSQGIEPVAPDPTNPRKFPPFNRHARFMVMDARMKQPDKNMFDLWVKTLWIFCDKGKGSMFEYPDPTQLATLKGEGKNAATITVGADGAVKVAVEAPRLPADEEFNSWLQLRVLNANFEWQKVLGKVRARNATLLKKKKKKAKAAKEVEEAAVVAAASASAEPEPEPES
jgi:hypothetical protein